MIIRKGMIVDVVNRRIFPGCLTVENGMVVNLEQDDTVPSDAPYILPGFVDAHIHIESSMMIPSEFARLAVVHGTVATVSDPHEIGNVLGIEGVRYMIENGHRVPFHFYFGAPSCVPATTFETAGASISAKEIGSLFSTDKLKYLSEIMNYPGVLSKDPLVMEKIELAHACGKPVDGHAPGLKGADAERYISAGISTDHECFTLEEALDKISYGMHILIREGSAAKNYDALHSLIKTHPEKVMFCSDDKHPHELVKGHLNQIVKRSIIDHGYNEMDVLRAAIFNPIQHYKLDVGMLQKGDSADFIVVDNLRDLNVLETFVSGVLVAKDGKTLISSVKASAPNHFSSSPKTAKDFQIPAKEKLIRVIQPMDGQLVTESAILPAKISEGLIVTDIQRDILKIAVVNRYQEALPAVAFIQNFGLKRGAIASSIAHDSHNIVVVGCSDEDIAEAANLLIKEKGGIAVVDGQHSSVLPLPVAGIMTNGDGYALAAAYEEIDRLAKELGTPLSAPFMTLSFMALLVIPSLKLSDKGLFDGSTFSFVPLQVP